jgi:hypothetical protein
MVRKWAVALFGLAVVVVAGCGGDGRCSVSGTVTYEDGSPVESAIVIGQATIDGKSMSVQGAVRNGVFTWGGAKEGDGALPGHYEVIVMPPSLSEYQVSQGMIPAIDGKFTRFTTSGLSFDVKAGKNEFPITVARPKKKG